MLPDIPTLGWFPIPEDVPKEKEVGLDNPGAPSVAQEVNLWVLIITNTILGLLVTTIV